MKLKSKTEVVDGTTFVVKELSMREFTPLMNRGEDADDADFTMALFVASVTEDGKPCDPDAIPARIYMKLLPIVIEFNGVGEAKVGNA